MWKMYDYEHKFLDQMLDMTIEYYGKDNDISNKEFVEHEYFKNNSGNAIIKLAYDEEEQVLAGQYIVIPMKIKVRRKIYPVILSLNTLTKEKYRGQKIFTILAEAVYEECKKKGYKFCYGAPNQNSHPGFIKKLSFKDAGIMPLFLKVMKPSRLISEKLNVKFLSYLSMPLNLFFRPLRKYDKTNIAMVSSKNIHLFDEFWNEIKDKYPIIGVRNTEYIQWRYVEMPRREYHIYIAKKNGKMVGYIIGRIMKVANMTCGMIVDFMVKEKETAVAKDLILHLENKYYSENVGLMGCLMQSHFEEAKFLKKRGYFKCPSFLEPQPFPIIFRKFNNMEYSESIDDFNNWFFTMGDYDVI